MALDKRETPLLILGPTSSEVFDAVLNGDAIPASAPSAELARQIRGWQELGATTERVILCDGFLETFPLTAGLRWEMMEGALYSIQCLNLKAGKRTVFSL